MRSMTGMGRARGKVGPAYFLVEIKSINHRFCEVHTHLPNRFQTFEVLLIQMIKKKIARGKIDIWLFEEKREGCPAVSKKALKSYFQFLKDVKDELGINEQVSLSHIQNGSSFWMIRENNIEKYAPAVKRLVNNALADLVRMRTKEGDNLKRQIQNRLVGLQKLKDEVELRKEDVVLTYQKKLKKRIDALIEGVEVDQAKLANEVAFLADRGDITEELERLSSHFSQMKKIMSGSDSCGRSLDFIVQEMNREWNTIASKAQDSSIAHKVVSAKSEMEKIREQIQNIE